MGRGLGKIQRTVLDVMKLNAEHLMHSSWALTVCVYCCELVTDAQVASVRRALRNLAKLGLVVDMGRRFRTGERHWALPEQARMYHRQTAKIMAAVARALRGDSSDGDDNGEGASGETV